MAVVAEDLRTSTTIRSCDDKNSMMNVVAEGDMNVQKAPQEGFAQQKMEGQVDKPNGTEEAVSAIIERQQLSLRKMGRIMCTSDHPFIVRLSKWGAERPISFT